MKNSNSDYGTTIRAKILIDNYLVAAAATASTTIGTSELKRVASQEEFSLLLLQFLFPLSFMVFNSFGRDKPVICN